MTASIISKISPQLYIKMVQKLKLPQSVFNPVIFLIFFLLQLSHIEVEMTKLTKASAMSG